MEYKKFVSLNVAVIGDGRVASMHTAALLLAGHEVFLAGKEVAESLWQYADNVHICSIEDAAAVADFIIIATQPKDVREVAYWLGDVRRKVIIDVTANVHTDDPEYINTVGAIAAITGSLHITKVFNTIDYQQLLKPLFGKDKIQLLLVGDSRKAKEITKIIARELGVTHFYDFGDNSTLPLFDEMTRCWRNMVEPAPALVRQLKKA